MTSTTPSASAAARPRHRAILGFTGRTEMIHRDDLALGGE